MKTILVTGSNGQLGSELKEIIKEYPYKFIFADLRELDITSKSSVELFFNSHQIDYCINAAAYTAVDKAESESALAFSVNVTGVKNLALACSKVKAPLIHISTDFIFDGKQQLPYIESVNGNPLNVYGQSKLESEKELQLHYNQHIIIRTSWLYSFYGKNFVKTMLKLGKEKDSLGVIADQIGCPTYAHDLAKAIMQIILIIEKAGNKNQFWGIYHYCNEGIASWYDFAKVIFELSGIHIKLKAIDTHEYPTPAVRPAYSVMNKTKIKSTFNLSIPFWKDSLAECIKKLNSNNG
jgi:dTDP-4-dehydrorhamnose reductase